VIFTFQPTGFPGLEVGFTRFYQVAWPDSGLTTAYFSHLFEGLFKRRLGRPFAPPNPGSNTSSDNQLASVFARWTLPHSGFEVYGEYGREDHNVDAHDLILEPDHVGAYGVGVRKAWRSDQTVHGVQVEIVNFETNTLARHRASDAFYVHEFTPQGHTISGQLLATGIGVRNGAGATARLERFARNGGWSASWSRLAARERPDSPDYDVQHVVSVRRLLFRGASTLRAGVTTVYDLNRDFGADRVNVRAELGAAWYP
jgi:hypothetical protein